MRTSAGLVSFAPTDDSASNVAWPEGADYVSTYRGLMDEALRGRSVPRIPLIEDPRIGDPNVGTKREQGIAGFYTGGLTPEGQSISISKTYGRSIPLRNAQQVVEHETSHAADMMTPGWQPGDVQGPNYSLNPGQKFDETYPGQGPLHPNSFRGIMSDVEGRPFGSRFKIDYPDTKEVRATYGKTLPLENFVPRVFVNVGGGKSPMANIPLSLPSFEDYKARRGTFAPGPARSQERLLPRTKGGARAAL